ncbi:2OG-Fe(II) oxygenase [Erythrobacter sp. F6033]|uniref:2OG-Fe(II) oxygenase n=1 Tax=Erythrobacter sp. F6033 TaxID=2926401 RepID=UPI001FF3EC0E|nr:2OG-Fe(II) oxygenase [Erythrobacter sp. F6033]MCK0129401.1 2OG-Fe(II) oxygenase [Erythrobacter sp. F6033]
MKQANISTSVTARLPRHHVETDFLSPSEHAALLEDSLAHETDYAPSQITENRDGRIEGGIVNTGTRRSGQRKIDPVFKEIFKRRIRACEARIADAIGVPFPAAHRFEIEAVHNGDGAFFSRHIDTVRGEAGRFRVISAVYYYCTQPKRFQGGELELYSLDQTQSVRVEPQNNTMLFFPSIFFHEVLPIAVPSQDFEAGRFSVNCWINQTGEPSTQE